MSISRHLLRLSLAAAPLALLAATPFAASAQEAVKPVPAGITSQLPRNAVPTHYAIRVTPDAAALSFTGDVTIDVTVVEATGKLVLNAADLTFGTATLAPAKGGAGVAAKVSTDADAQTATFAFAQPLTPGAYKLTIAYKGVINTQANGLFALDYTDNAGAQKRALFTQFEAPDARRFVPSWDEPSYKATFDLTAIVPTGQIPVGNMPVASTADIGNGKTKVVFGTTPKMSTYLLFFGTGEFDRVTKMAGKTEVGVLTGKGNADKAGLALDASAQILPFYNDYFGVDYPLPKLDNVAGPGQSQFFSAMENWGAIFTFERVLLDDPGFTSEATRQSIYEVVAHEMAHQWFGDLVTMAWWDDLWLNEGFASWMATKATAHFKPEWKFELGRVSSREAAMALDAFKTTHPVVQKLTTVDQISQAFDSITYSKGEAVITMLEAYATPDVWRKGIRSYVAKHSYGNTVTDDLWTSVQDAGAQNLVSIAHDFTQNPGIPLVKVEAASCAGGSTRLTLSQGEYSRDAKDKTPLNWNVPVIAQTLGGAEMRAVLSGGKGEITLPGCGAYNINVGQTGYYRTLYPTANLTALTKGFASLAPIDQMGLIADNWALGGSGYEPFTVALNLLDAVKSDAGPFLLADSAPYLEAIYGLFGANTPQAKKAAAYASAKLSPALEKLGYDPKPGDGSQDIIMRQRAIASLGAMGDAKVVAEAKKRFAALKANPAALDGPLKETWLRIIAANADQATWDALRAMAKTAPSQVQQASLFTLLGRAKDDALAAKALDLAMTDEPGKTNSAAIISAVSDGKPDLATDYALAHYADYEKLIDASSRSRAIGRLADSSGKPEMVEKLEAYAQKYLTPESRKPVDQAISAIRDRVASNAIKRDAAAGWLAKKK